MDMTLLKVENRWQELVRRIIARLVEENLFSCSCRKCQADAEAIALNKLPPDYVPVGFTPPEDEAVDAPAERLRQAEQAVREALVLVKKAPLHGGASEPKPMNSNEDLVRMVLADILHHQTDKAWTEQQLAWVLAYSLRELSPRYTTTPKGDAYARVEEIQPGSMAAIYVAVHKSLKRVEAEFSVG